VYADSEKCAPRDFVYASIFEDRESDKVRGYISAGEKNFRRTGTTIWDLLPGSMQEVICSIKPNRANKS
jgi:hypothetical protein